MNETQRSKSVATLNRAPRTDAAMAAMPVPAPEGGGGGGGGGREGGGGWTLDEMLLQLMTCRDSIQQNQTFTRTKAHHVQTPKRITYKH